MLADDLYAFLRHCHLIFVSIHAVIVKSYGLKSMLLLLL